MTPSPTGPLRVGIGGPVGSGKTALMDALCRQFRDRFEIAAITNDIYTKEDAEFLTRAGSLVPEGKENRHLLELTHRKRADAILGGNIQFLDQPGNQIIVPVGIEGCRIVDHISDRHPLVQIDNLGDIADPAFGLGA